MVEIVDGLQAIAVKTPATPYEESDPVPADPYRGGVIIGSGIGGLPGIERNYHAYLQGGPRKISPFFVPGNIINMISGNFSIKHGIKGPNIALVTACSTCTHSIGQAARMIA